MQILKHEFSLQDICPDMIVLFSEIPEFKIPGDKNMRRYWVTGVGLVDVAVITINLTLQKVKVTVYL